jgi:predicted AlkP superfamily phosphohydrolase/phosphomutase
MIRPRGSIVMLGFDAMDPILTEQMAQEGALPAFRSLFDSASRRRVRNPPGLFVGSLWSTFFTGRSAVETGFHCWEEVEPGGYERRVTTAAAIRGRPFWEALSDAGKRVAVIDVPHSRAGTAIDGIQISEWGCHDRHFGFRTHPPELAQQIIDRVGLHPILTADPFAVREWAPDDYLFREGELRSADEARDLLAGLLDGAEGKRRLCLEILEQGPWDLFISVFGEPHSVGHQLWHLHDPSHPGHDPDARARIGDPLRQVYEQMDRALAEHVARIDQHDTLLVLLSHGMGPHYDGTHLLPEILRRLDGVYRAAPDRSLEGQLLGSAWRRMPGWARRAAGRPLAAVLRTRLRRRDFPRPPEYETAEQRRAQAFFMSPNNFVVGGVRINLEGREAEGFVRSGRDFEELCRRLEDDLLALVNVDTGGNVIDRVERSDQHYDRRSLDALPDLFLEWNHDHPIEAVWSPRFGLIRSPYLHWRTGDHHPGGLLLVHGAGITSGAKLEDIEINDVGAWIASMLGVSLDDGERGSRTAVPAPAGLAPGPATRDLEFRG